jgi:protein-disulfide isomerase
MNQPHSGARQLLTTLVAVVTLISAPLAWATPADDARLVDRISSEVVKKLQQGGALDRAIDAGIDRYVARHREARAAAARRREQEVQRKAEKVRPADPTSDHIYGNPSATVSLIEYSDFECPFCKRFAPMAKSLVDSSDGKVSWVYRHFPLDFHNPMSQRESEGSECAAELGGNAAFWKYALRLFALTSSNGKGIPGGKLETLAKEIGLDPAAFDACLKSGRHADAVQKDYAEGLALGVTGTPDNILRNNQTGKVLVRTGALPLAQIQAAVSDLLQKKAEPAAPSGAKASE